MWIKYKNRLVDIAGLDLELELDKISLPGREALEFDTVEQAEKAFKLIFDDIYHGRQILYLDYQLQ